MTFLFYGYLKEFISVVDLGYICSTNSPQSERALPAYRKRPFYPLFRGTVPAFQVIAKQSRITAPAKPATASGLQRRVCR